MVTGLKFKKIVKVELDKHNKIKVDGERVGIKEVPYIRYDLGNYTVQELSFIEEMKEKFPHSVHIVDVDLQHEHVEVQMGMIKENIENVVIFGIYTLDDSTKDNYEKVLQDLRNVNIMVVEKLVLRDKTTYMMLPEFKKLEKLIFKETGKKGISLCSSPITDTENCCINAEYSRNLAAKYGDDETANAVATHQNTCAGCTCVRYAEIEEDIVATSGSSKKEKENGGKKEGKKVEKKAKSKISAVPSSWL